ncbi:MAG: metal ABC transporter permease [Clostridiales bacterium]|nr:metal ABC transporter permease [Clostridiales bacterium]
MEIFQYDFIQKALIISVLISILIPLIGVVVVLKRLSTMGEALSHTSLAGVAVGLVAGLNPVLMAAIISIIASLAIEYIRKAFPKYSEIATNVVLSAGIGLAAVLSGFVENPANFNSFLFGSLIAVGNFEVGIIIVLSVIVITVNVLLYKELFAITVDEEGAKLSGVPVGRINFIFTIMTAITVSVASRTVGALMISSLIVIPVACALLISKSYKQTVLLSIGFAMLFTLSGLFVSFYFDLKPGGTIVLIGVAILFVIIIMQKLFRRQSG